MSLRTARRLEGVRRTLIRRIFDSAPAGAVNLGLGEPDLPTPACVALGGIEGIAAGHTGYTSTAGDPELRAAVADSYAEAPVGPDGVLITAGSQEALFAACLALVDSGEEILYPDPGYPAYGMLATLIGARPVAYDLPRDEAFRPTVAELERKLSDRTRLVLFNSPSNPTGSCISRARLAELFALLDRRGVAWIVDEVYAGLRYESEPFSALELSADGGLVVSGLSKELSMTGWRIGWVAGQPSVISRVAAVHQQLVTCAPSISQRAALRAFTPEGRRARREHLELFRSRRELMGRELARLPGLVCEPPEGAFYYFVDVSSYGDDLELCRRILDRQGVITIPGRAFGRGGTGFLRISFAATEDSIRRGIAGIAEELSRLADGDN